MSTSLGSHTLLVSKKYDVVIVGGGHNGLVAACYLAKAGLSVHILEREESLGGATVSQKVFPEYDAKLSRYSYLVSLLPQKIIDDLGLSFETLGRSVASYTPDASGGLLVSTQWNSETERSFESLTGSTTEFAAWQSFYNDILHFAEIVAPTLLEKLPTRSQLKEAVNHDIWNSLIEMPIGVAIEERFANDLVRGVILTDGLIGTFADAHDLAANRCFLYHLVGNQTGEWRVPKGGMGRLVNELIVRATSLGVSLETSSEVISISHELLVTCASGATYIADFVLANCAPQVLARLTGKRPPSSLEGSQVKINMLLRKLPRLKSGLDPKIAFAGTFHIDERYSDLQKAYEESAAGKVPGVIPAEMYCHTLTDPSILSQELIDAGYQTLTLFGIHTPATLFDIDNEAVKQEITSKLLNQLNKYLVDPIEGCLARNSDGRLCVETKSPLDLEESLSLPRGNIFHKELSFPFREDGTPESWGVETTNPKIFICGAGAIRGGGVSGIPGHNAAMAVLEKL
jgi:phytoene dehydrogenase-like protein